MANLIEMYFLYLLKSLKNNKIYTGYTSKNPEMRRDEHNQRANTWSRNNGPFKLIYYEEYHCLKDAISRERFYKTGFGKNIKKLIAGYIDRKNITVLVK